MCVIQQALNTTSGDFIKGAQLDSGGGPVIKMLDRILVGTAD